ncbi:MAG: helix-turn-helix domain-containing protein [Micromonosporaceae bacterium]
MADASPTLRRKVLGIEMRRLREAAAVTPADAGSVLEVSDSTIYRIEKGRVGIKPRDVEALLNRYGVTEVDDQDRLKQLAKEGKQRGWWAKHRGSLTAPYANYIGLEVEARALLTYDALVIPGLLQTEAYARALYGSAAELATASQIENRVRVRMARQDRLRGENPIHLSAVIDEAVIRRMIGGPDVMAAQLKHLAEAVQAPHVRLWVLPLAGGTNPGAITSFAIMEFEEADLKIVYIEGLNGDMWEEDDDADRYYAVYNHLRAASLPPTESLRLIESVAKELA